MTQNVVEEGVKHSTTGKKKKNQNIKEDMLLFNIYKTRSISSN
jgi:hypothetical protein